MVTRLELLYEKADASSVCDQVLAYFKDINSRLKNQFRGLVVIPPGSMRVVGNKYWQGSFVVCIAAIQPCGGKVTIASVTISQQQSLSVQEDEFNSGNFLTQWDSSWKLDRNNQLSTMEQLILQDEDKNYYQILGLEFQSNVSHEDIKQAFHKKILYFHPDKQNQDSKYNQYHATKVLEAWQILGVEESRKKYDATLLKSIEGNRNWFSYFTSPSFWKTAYEDGRLKYLIPASVVVAGAFALPVIVAISGGLAIPVMAGIGSISMGLFGSGISINSYLMSLDCEKNGIDNSKLAKGAAIGGVTGLLVGAIPGAVASCSVGSVLATSILEGVVQGATSSFTSAIAAGAGNGVYEKNIKAGEYGEVVKNVGITTATGLIAGGVFGAISGGFSQAAQQGVDFAIQSVAPNARQIIAQLPLEKTLPGKIVGNVTKLAIEKLCDQKD